MAKRKFAGGNPFISRKKYRGALFGARSIRGGRGRSGQIGGGGWVVAPINTNNPRYGAIPDKNRVIVPPPGKIVKRKPVGFRKQTKVSSSHNDLTVQKLTSVKVGVQRPKRCSARALYQNIEQVTVNGPLGVVASQGRQAMVTLPSMMNGNWISGTTSAARDAIDTLPDSLYLFDEQIAPDSGVTNAVAKAVDRTRFHLKSIHLEYGLLSMTTVPQVVDVYWITPKYDALQAPIDFINQLMINNADGQNAASNSRTVATNTAGAGGAARDNWGFNPWVLKEFRGAYRCLKKFKLTLNPGDQKHISFNMYWNKTIRREMVNEGRNRIALTNITVYPLIIARAGLVGIKLTADAEAKEVAFGTPKVGVSSKMTIKTGLFPIGNRANFARVYKGMVEDYDPATDVLREIDDEDIVKAPVKN